MYTLHIENTIIYTEVDMAMIFPFFWNLVQYLFIFYHKRYLVFSCPIIDRIEISFASFNLG